MSGGVSGKDVYFIGVDVGTGSVRAALVNQTGKILRVETKSISTWNPKPDFYQQSSDDIWNSCCTVVKKVKGTIPIEEIKGIGFDATCSLVAVDKNGKPVSVSPNGEAEQNVILWMDHRAKAQADYINSFNHNILRNVGGKVSLEMEIPKLLWLKENLPTQCWDVTDKYFDLPDFLTWKATGCDSRSLCSVVCKWLYEVCPDGEKRWNYEFMREIGLECLLEENARKIGSLIKEPGEPVGAGLSAEGALALGLQIGTPVGTSIIDAHAGGLGLIGSSSPSVPREITSRISLICGTSTCHMGVSKEAVYVPGVWGPYWSAMVPGLWLSEAGQSATGSLIDHIISSHPARSVLRLQPGQHISEYLNMTLEGLADEKGVAVDMLTLGVHVWPDYHGNRSPLADATLKGMVCGLDLSANEENLAVLYLATMQALAYGTKHIMEVLSKNGHGKFSAILICGGLSKNELFVRTHAAVCEVPVLVPHEPESVLLGAAMLGATASRVYDSVLTAIDSMAGPARIISPDPNLKRYHELKYKVFLKMLDDQLSYRSTMSEINI